jgi:adenylate cyclase
VGFEIERKFLATPAVLPLCQSGTLLTQGYLFTDAVTTIRIRRAGDRMLMTWKGPRTGISRSETEFEVAWEAGEALLASIPPHARIEKTRYRIEHTGATWDVDVFGSQLHGLILAEIELPRDDQLVVIPPWVSAEVTADERYRNSRLAAAMVLQRDMAC